MFRLSATATCGAVAVFLAVALPGKSAGSQHTPETKKATGCGPRLIVEYTDDDPDYFIIKNRSAQGWALTRLAIDLAGTPGDLVFDPDDGGPGVGGAAAFYSYSDAPVRLTGTLPAQDGGRTIALQFEGFSAGLDYTFHIDLDALQGGDGRTWVLPSDMAGARVVATFAGPSGQNNRVDALFDERAEADSGAGGCV